MDGKPPNFPQPVHERRLPMLCVAQKSRYTHLRDNDIRGSLTNLYEVCNAVKVEPCLQALKGESFANPSTKTEDDARLDIRAKGARENRFYNTL